MGLSVLVVDDDEHVGKDIVRQLTRFGYEPVAAGGGSRAIGLLRERRFDAVVCDLHMPEVDGFDVLRFSAGLSSPPPFIMMTAYGSVANAVEAMKHGASDFLEKPVSAEELRASLQSLITRRQQEEEPAPGPRSGSKAIERPKGLVGSERWLGPFLESLHKIARTDALVLIEGETGTGKSAVAREIYRSSSRAKGPFVELNCAAIPETLLESQLFGHVRGAFTGATSNQTGKVEQANGGTFFLDEVGELKSELQAKLLHLLQERTFTPLGAHEPRQADVRFVAATNRNLERDVQAGTFRMDLYYRLNVVSLTIPPLRERPDDVPVLVEHFRETVATRVGHRAPQFSEATLHILRRYEWPGNVRELENLVERMAVLHAADATVEPKDLPDRFRLHAREVTEIEAVPQFKRVTPPDAPSGEFAMDLDGVSLSDALRSYERQMILNALRRAGGNKSQAAKHLKMKRTTLIEKCRKLEIGPADLSSVGASDDDDDV
jgi:DNA-binding NtrC family response regulator